MGREFSSQLVLCMIVNFRLKFLMPQSISQAALSFHFSPVGGVPVGIAWGRVGGAQRRCPQDRLKR